MVVMVRHLYQKCHLVHADLSGEWVGWRAHVRVHVCGGSLQPAAAGLPVECVSC